MMPPNKKTTIYEVANEANVSVSTVSLVLSGKGRISTATIDRVQMAIEKLGYTPNRQASMLRGGQSGVIGMILQHEINPFYAEAISGINAILNQHSRILFLTQCKNDPNHLRDSFQKLYHQGIDGLIIASYPDEAVLSTIMAESGNLPKVYLAPAGEIDGVDLIRPNNTLMAQLATDYLIKQGHRNIAYVGGDANSMIRAERLAGMLASLIKHQLPFNAEKVVEGEQFSLIARATEQLLQRWPTVSAIICDEMTPTLSTYFTLLRLGKSIATGKFDTYYEQKISLISLTVTPAESLRSLALECISTPAKMVGEHAAMRLLQRLNGVELPVQQIVLPPTWQPQG
ncbi:Mal regulon transcriptional regulator MalI [Orbaceae bacterium ESL0721]|nr:Mal regulon transcriptional regulator MalI [Orbaceae bacterium ESL0721]